MILVANHASLLDGVLIHASCRRPLRIFIAGEWADWWPIRRLARVMGAIRVERDRANPDAFGAALAAIERGDAVALFPEGGIQAGGGLGSFRNGAARLALRTGAPVFPCAIIGSFDALPWPRRFPRPRRITVRCGQPLRFSAPSGRASLNDFAAVSEKIREAVRGLILLGHG